MFIEKYIISRLKLKNIILNDKPLTQIEIPLRYRPDILMFFPRRKHYVILEIDERQHNSYNIHKELMRYIRIRNEFKPLGTLQIVRFNPHGYISKYDKVLLDDRIMPLQKLINKCISHKEDGLHHLYFSKINKHMNLAKNI